MGALRRADGMAMALEARGFQSQRARSTFDHFPFVARDAIALLIALSPVDLATAGPVSLSYPVLLFTATASLLTALVCGLAPISAHARARLAAMAVFSAFIAAGRSSMISQIAAGNPAACCRRTRTLFTSCTSAG
jgi:hypothetical protein